jgi:hypothetical protein
MAGVALGADAKHVVSTPIGYAIPMHYATPAYEILKPDA